MRASRVREKLKADKPVLVTKANITDPILADMIGLLGFDCLWVCQEHVPIDGDRLAHLIRTASMNDMDIMVRTDKGAYSDFIHPLELGAAGLMVPHCMSVAEARHTVAMTRFHPVGRRPLDSGNADGHYCMIPMADYLQQANDKTFLVVQIEDPEAVECVEEIAAIPGIDALFVGPADLSHGMGVPGNTKHPSVVKAIERVAAACKKHGRAWGLPVSAESAPEYMQMGARFLASGADVLGLHVYFKQLRQNFEKLGFEFVPKI